MNWETTKSNYLSGNTELAIEQCVELIHLDPGHTDAMNMLGVIALSENQTEKALEWFDRALSIAPLNTKILVNKSTALINIKQWENAISISQKIVSMSPENADAWNNLGIAQRHAGRSDLALKSFEKALTLDQSLEISMINRAFILHEMHRFEEAVSAFDKILALRPQLGELWSARGNSLRDLGKTAESLSSYEKAIDLHPDSADLWYNKGNLFHSMGKIDKALECYDKALNLNPDHKKSSSLYLHLSLKTADWKHLDKSCSRENKWLADGTTESEPFSLLSMPGINSKEILTAAQNYVNKKPASKLPRKTFRKKANPRKLRIAYVSSDYFMHATAVLMAGVFEKHDRNKFEIYAICLGAPTEDPMRQRLKSAFDHFIDVSKLSDAEAAERVRSLEIDIAIDLKGHTEDNRFSIFLHSIAPLQVTYLGFPGTTGSNHIDYIIGDKFVTPFADESFYSEKIIQLPDCYQCNDSNVFVHPITPTRRSVGLPDDAFVFCCFNNTYKINPEIFSTWMEILKCVPNGVLWLLQDNPTATNNLRKNALLSGIAPERLFFAPRTPHPQHLARQKLADLFLDTLPYNAHTTTSDAIRVGLPVITCVGETFAGRVAASLLSCAGFTETITHNMQEYKKLAIDLASHPAKAKELKAKLFEGSKKSSLYDTEKFTQNLEKAYLQMWDNYQNHRPPEHFAI